MMLAPNTIKKKYKKNLIEAALNKMGISDKLKSRRFMNFQVENSKG